MRDAVQVPFLVRDRQYLRDQKKPASGPEILIARPTQPFTIRGEEPFFDGPVTGRVAVLDFDADTGRLRPGARFIPQGIGRTVSTYELDEAALDPDPAIETLESDAFIQISTFATVMKTLHFFEGPEMLGRRISWAFDSPQLLVIPRAGEMANAFYERESGSLQFFYYRAGTRHVVYTALSHDIVTHETAHAVLDGIAPDLYHAATPQSLALHETIADMTSIMSNLLNELVVYSLFNISSSQLDVDSVLSRIAEEFGSEIRRDVGADFLRAANNDRTLDPDVTSVDRFGAPNSVDRTDPHALSEVMSGAIYQVFLRSVRELGRKYDAGWEERYGSFLSADEKRVSMAARRVSRMVFRALDYLPPGEVSFADLGRAMLAADLAAHSRPRAEQRWLQEELLRRRVVSSQAELNVATGLEAPELHGFDLEELAENDEAALQFAERNRELLRIPARKRFRVLPRRVAVRPHGKKGQDSRKELIFRVSWEREEVHDLGPRFQSRWVFPTGTTLVLDSGSRRVRSVLTTDPSPSQRADRAFLLRKWTNEGFLTPEEEALSPDGRFFGESIVARQAGRAMRVRGSARMLHVVGDPS